MGSYNQMALRSPNLILENNRNRGKANEAGINFNLPRTRTNTNPNDTEANAAGRSGNARALRKQSKCGVIHEGERHRPKFSKNCTKSDAFVGSRHSAETIEEGARAQLVTCGSRSPIGRGQNLHFSAQSAGRLLFWPLAMRGPGRTGTPFSSAEWL